ncbi:protein lin-28-like [Lutzomyia longipalpis]|uniref:protein lin-28-like n=1 Tax=Lutzomyia longipalpis TaxID=7200 RepID=UPI002483641E|nr:protein lin-28-like [Lutzomyia longipalpis]
MAHLGSLLKQIEYNRLYAPQPNLPKRGSQNQNQVQEVSEQQQRGINSRGNQRGGRNNQNTNRSGSRNEGQNAVKCVNCGGPHKIKDCKEPRKCNVMCYKCGLENTITSRCPVCNTKGGDRASR